MPRSSGDGGDQEVLLEGTNVAGGQDVVSEEWWTEEVEVARSVRA